MKRLLWFSLFLGVAVLASSCVKEKKVEPDHSVLLIYNDATLEAGTSKQLVSKNYWASDLIWSSTDPTVADVDVTGMITAHKPGTTTIDVKSKTYAVSATCKVTVVQSKATDVGVGADGSVYVVGDDSVSTTGGHGIYKWVDGGLYKLPDCAAIRVAVSPQGVPWVVNKSNLIFRYNGTSWDQLPGTATDIGIGKDGSVFIVGTQFATPTGGNIIQKWNGSGWDTMQDCAGVRITVDPTGTPWVVNKSNIVFQYGGTYLWNPIYGVTGDDIAAGGDGSLYVSSNDANSSVYKYTAGAWAQVPGISNATNLSADANGKIWYIDKSGVLHSPN